MNIPAKDKLFDQTLGKPIFRLFVFWILILIFASMFKGNVFWSTANLKSMAIQLPEYGILSICFALCLSLAGGNDLSAVAVANFTAVSVGLLLIHVLPDEAGGVLGGFALTVAILSGLVTGTAIGFINGLIITKIGINAIITTLGTQEVFMGLAIVLTRGGALSNVSPALASLGSYHFFGVIPLPLIVFLVVIALVGFLISKTTFGYKFFMVGINRTAAKYSGLDTDRITILVHTLSGTMGAIAGLVMLARNNSANANYGTSYLIEGILIAILGGTEGEGGYTNMLGVLIGVLTIQSMASTLNIFRVSSFYKDLLFGLILVAVLAINHAVNMYRRKRGVKKLTIGGKL
jgi:simple sugar transport system permease protein